MNKISIRYNERSWAIELISQINSIAEKNDLLIKRAGGESTISYGPGRMFPDVILYGDDELSFILQGWELKMPDVPITDDVFVADAQRKARALGLQSCVIWNFTFVKFYVLDEATDDFEVIKEWYNPEIKSRQDVNTYRKTWESTLEEVVLSLNQYFLTKDIKRVSIGEVISHNAIDIIINANKQDVAKNYRKESIRDAVMEAHIDSWWQSIKGEYSLDELDKYSAYAKQILLNWAYRIIFAHLIKRHHKTGAQIDDLNEEYTPAQANDLFREITEKSDFYNVFSGIKYNDILPLRAWNSLIELSLFLKDNGIQSINQAILQNILEKCIDNSRRELNGQYTTPRILAKLLSYITVHDWTRDCIDPCCGTGTIAHEILKAKKKHGMAIEDAVATTWASDKFEMPLQIANLSLTSSDTINLPNRLFQQNALSLTPGKIVSIVDPSNGNKISYAIPLLGSICSNLPFVAFENISKLDKELIEKNDSINVLNERSDLSYYILLQMAEMLADDGYMGVITSNSWLGTTAGSRFYDAMLEKFDLKQVHISGCGRWFLNAKVVTTILVLQKRQEAKKKSTTFFVWKRPLEYIAISNATERTIINSALLNESQDEDVISACRYSPEEIEKLHELNLSYNALFHNVKWLLSIKHKLIPVSSVFNIFRGSRRGWDKLFFPGDRHNIEDEFIIPALFNSRGVTSLITVPDKQAFICGKPLEELAEKYPGAYKWIKKFEREVNGVGKPLPKVLARRHEKWYEMKPNEISDFFMLLNPDERIFVGRFLSPTFINQRLIGLHTIDPFADNELFHALLNSILMKFFIEAVGFGRGEGVLDISKDNVSKCYMLDPKLLSRQQAELIKSKFRVITAKQITNVFDELEDGDWVDFNRTVLRAFGIEVYYEVIVSSFRSLVKVRKAVNMRFDSVLMFDPSMFGYEKKYSHSEAADVEFDA